VGKSTPTIMADPMSEAKAFVALEAINGGAD